MEIQPAIAPVTGMTNGAQALENPATSNSSKISFDSSLKNEETKLEEKQKSLSLIPWASLQNIFNSVPLKFDFQFSSASLGPDDRGQKRDPEITGRQQAEMKKDSAASASNNTKNDTASVEKLSRTIDQKTFVQNLLANVKPVVGGAVPPAEFSLIFEPKVRRPSLDLIVSEIVDKVRLVEEGKKVELSVALKPDQLGEMLLNMSMKNGLVSISIVANSEAKEWLEHNIAALKDSLRQANIGLGDVSVSSGSDGKSSFKPSNDKEDLAALVPYLQTTDKAPVLGSRRKIDPLMYARYWNQLFEHRIFSRA